MLQEKISLEYMSFRNKRRTIIKGIIYIVNILILLILKKCYSLHNDIAIHRAKYVGRYVLTHSPNS